MNREVRSVLFVTTSFPRFKGDFAGSFVFRFAKYLVRDGIKVTVLAPGAHGYPSSDEIDDIQIYRFPYFFPIRYQRLAYDGGGIMANIRNSWLARIQIPILFFSAVRSIIRHQIRCQLIHCHWTPMSFAALLARSFSRVKLPIILTNWGSDTRLLPAYLTRWIVSRVDGCISTATETDEHLLSAGYTKFRRIMAPIDEERFSRINVKPDLLNELNIRNDIPILAFIGRLTDFKDPITLIRACALLRQQRVPFISLIMGDGDLMSACRREIEYGKLQKQVFLLGTRSDPERLLRIANVLVHVSPIENTWANVIAEAMFMEVPVIMSDAGYTRRLFSHKRDCLIIPASNPEALAKAFHSLISDVDLSLKLTNGAKMLLRQRKKDSKSIVADTKTYYKEIINAR
ncbi:MAG: glycosyltransferase family 4 protein [Pseudomonadota bacterium]